MATVKLESLYGNEIIDENSVNVGDILWSGDMLAGLRANMMNMDTTDVDVVEVTKVTPRTIQTKFADGSKPWYKMTYWKKKWGFDRSDAFFRLYKPEGPVYGMDEE